jgi:putative restriction endonuclease
MRGKIDCYTEAFKKLRTDRNRTRWSPLTTYRAPHKPFLLLSVLDHIAQGLINSNLIAPDYELVETFGRYWSRIMPLGTSGNIAYPFVYMDSEPFWHLSPKPGVKIPTGKTISSVKRIKELFYGARLDDELFPLLLVDYPRERLKETLITTYFAPEAQAIMREQGEINRDAFAYSENLLRTSEAKPESPSADDADEKKKKVRDQGFRRAIVNLYEHRCALCGIRMMTPAGHTVVEAAHIEPWCVQHDDKPSNGMALCRLCHWSFDEGLMTVNTDYEVKVSKTVRQDNNFPGHILTLSDRPIFKPGRAKFWPAQDNLDYHRKKIFIK